MFKNSKMSGKSYLLLILYLINFRIASAQAPNLVFQPVISGLNFPIDIVNAGDGTNRIFIAHQGGLIKVYDQSLAYLGDFLTVSDIGTGGERSVKYCLSS